MKINEKIQMYRKQAGLSQEALAEEIKVSRQAISKWESGLAQPTLDNCKELCRVFKIDLNQLCQEENIETVIQKKEYFKVGQVLLLMGIVISLGLNGYMLYQLNQTKEEMESLKERIESVRSLMNQSKTEIIYSENPGLNDLQSFDIQGDYNGDNQVDLSLLVRLNKQNEKTQVGCSIRSLNKEYDTEATLQSDYSFLITSTVDLVDDVHIECYKMQEDEITYLVSEDYAIKFRFIQDVDVYIDDSSFTKPYENELILAFSPMNQYGAFSKDSKGNSVTKMDFTVTLMKQEEVLDTYNNVLEEKMDTMNDQTYELGLYSDATVFAYFKMNKDDLKQDGLSVVLRLVLNDLDIIEREYKLSDLKFLRKDY